MKCKMAIGIIFLLLGVNKSFAWGPRGHSIIAEIAFSYLDDQTRKNVLNALNGMTIEEAANWMDEIRSDHQYDFLKPCHYIDLPKGASVSAATGSNILGLLGKTFEELNDISHLSREDIQTRLLYLFHLIGDLHQPLHVGYPDDKGGNTFQVSFFGKGSNLHRVWDSEIIEYMQLNKEMVMASQKISPQQLKAIQDIQLVKWATESRTYLEALYTINGHKVDEQYLRMAEPIIEKQLMYAGLRLAAVLRHYFQNIPRTNATVQSAVRPSDQIPAVDVHQTANYVGRTVKICERVYQAKYLATSNKQPTFLDLGDEYPRSPLTVVIWGEDRKNFSHEPDQYYPGKKICITGKVILFKGKPEIIARTEDQIELQ